MSILLSARQAEEANRDLARIARASSNSGLMLIPVVAVTQQSGSSRTPRVHLSKSGEFIARPAHVPGAGSSSGAPRERSGASSGQRRPRDESAAPRGPAIPGMGPSVTQQRSKRPKLSQPARHSFSSAADQQDNAKALLPCRRVLKELMHHHMAWPFLKPVDPMQVPGYYDVIKDAIDLGTIKKRLEGNQYDDIEEFEHEVHRVWDNCFKFNQEGTDVHTMAIGRSRRFDCFPPMARATSFAGVGIRIAIDRESHRIPTSTRSRRARPSVARRRARARGRAIFLG